MSITSVRLKISDRRPIFSLVFPVSGRHIFLSLQMTIFSSPYFLSWSSSYFRNIPKRVFLLGGFFLWIHQGRPVRTYTHRWADQTHYTPLELAKALRTETKFTVWTSIVFKRNIIDKIGGLDPSYEAVDIDFLLRVKFHFSGIISPEVCSSFRMHQGSISYQMSLATQIDERLKMFEKFKAQMGSSSQEIRDLYYFRFEREVVREVLILLGRNKGSEVLACLELLKKFKSKKIRCVAFLSKMFLSSVLVKFFIVSAFNCLRVCLVRKERSDENCG